MAKRMGFIGWLFVILLGLLVAGIVGGLAYVELKIKEENKFNSVVNSLYRVDYPISASDIEDSAAEHHNISFTYLESGAYITNAIARGYAREVSHIPDDHGYVPDYKVYEITEAGREYIDNLRAEQLTESRM